MRFVRRLIVITLLVLAAGAAGGCGADEPTAPPDTTGGENGREVAIYLIHDGRLAAVRRLVHHATTPPEYPTLLMLYTGPTDDELGAGYLSALRTATDGSGQGMDIEGGLATVKTTTEVPRLAQAQIVHTLTQFPSIDRVVFDRDGETGKPLTRKDFEDVAPQILIESPLPGDTVSSPVRLRGTANVFEATVSIEVRNGSGKAILKTFTTATSGTGTRGAFDTKLDVPSDSEKVTIVAFEASAEDGRPLHVVEVPVTVRR